MNAEIWYCSRLNSGIYQNFWYEKNWIWRKLIFQCSWVHLSQQPMQTSGETVQVEYSSPEQDMNFHQISYQLLYSPISNKQFVHEKSSIFFHVDCVLSILSKIWLLQLKLIEHSNNNKNRWFLMNKLFIWYVWINSVNDGLWASGRHDFQVIQNRSGYIVSEFIHTCFVQPENDI